MNAALLALKSEPELRPLLDSIVESLKVAGAYTVVTPFMVNTGMSAADMVVNYGLFWDEYPSETRECPHCKADLRDASGPPFVRAIGVVDKDFVAEWKCPECQASWERTR